MGHTAIKSYTADATWTAPGGVTSVLIVATQKRQGLLNASAGGIDSYGNLFLMGGSDNGGLGQGDVTARSSPVAVLGGIRFGRTWQLDDRTRYALAVDGQLYGWGGNANGGLGLGDVTPRSSPVAVLGGLRWAAMTAEGRSGNDVCMLTTNGKAYAMGLNLNGQLGVGDVTPRSSPVAVLGGLTFVKLWRLTNGYAAMTAAGALYSWGDNSVGQLGVGDVASRSSPVAVLGGLTFKDFVHCPTTTGAAGSSFGLTTTGVLYAWGGNANGQLGVGDVAARSSPVAVLGSLTWKQVCMSSGKHVLGLTTAGVAYAWGINTVGCLGLGDVASRSSPVAVLGSLTFTKLFTGVDLSSNAQWPMISFGLTSAGALYSWGLNNQGQLGLGDNTNRSSPVAVVGGLVLTDLMISASTTGGSGNPTFCMATDAYGNLYAWGSNDRGQLGLGDSTGRSSPVAVVGGFAANVVDEVITTRITVTPGTAYALSIGRFQATFGTTAIGRNVTSVDLRYEQ